MARSSKRIWLGASVIALVAAIGWWAAPRSAAAPAVGTSQGMGQRVSIDPATGQIRPVEHDDLQQTLAPAAIGPEPERRAGASGGVVLQVPEELHVYTVARRGPDGKVSIEHVNGTTAATARVSAEADKARRNSATEVPNDR